METNEFNKLFNIIIKRAKTGKNTSYTRKLLNNGSIKIAQKVGEESTELIIDYLKGSKKTIEEAVDLIYHLFVMLYSKNIKFNDIEKEIIKRKNVRR